MHTVLISELPTIILTDFLSTIKHTIYERNIHEKCQVTYIMLYIIIIYSESDILLYIIQNLFND